MRGILFFCTAVFTGLLCLAPLPAQAHRVNIFAYVDGNDIVVECGFNKSQKVRQGQIEVTDAATGDILLRGKTNDQGMFRFPVPSQAREAAHDLRIHINAGEGHQNDWTVAAAEFVAAPTGGASTDVSASPTRGTSVATISPENTGKTAGTATPADVQRIVDAALDAKLAPIKRMLVEQFEAGPGLREIIGGIGWIFGIVGVAAYFRRRP